MMIITVFSRFADGSSLDGKRAPCSILWYSKTMRVFIVTGLVLVVIYLYGMIFFRMSYRRLL